MKKTHKDVEFHIDTRQHGDITRVFKVFDEAVGFAVAHGLSRGEPITVDVVIWSKAGARFYGGDDAVEQYLDDPEASVFERIVIKANSQGRVP